MLRVLRACISIFSLFTFCLRHLNVLFQSKSVTILVLRCSIYSVSFRLHHVPCIISWSLFNLTRLCTFHWMRQELSHGQSSESGEIKTKRENVFITSVSLAIKANEQYFVSICICYCLCEWDFFFLLPFRDLPSHMCWLC